MIFVDLNDPSVSNQSETYDQTFLPAYLRVSNNLTPYVLYEDYKLAIEMLKLKLIETGDEDISELLFKLRE